MIEFLRNYCGGSKIPQFVSHSVGKKISHQKNNSSNHLLVTYLVKPLLSRNFYQKCVRENSRNFHTVTLWCNANIQCLKSRRANFCKAFLLYSTQISEQAYSDLAEPNFKQKFLTHSILRMLTFFVWNLVLPILS